MQTIDEIRAIADEKDPARRRELSAEASKFVWGQLPETSRAKFFEFRGRQACAQRAAAKPLPGAAGDAFTKGALKVNGKIVHRVVPTHFAVLQALNSPLMSMMDKAAKESKADVNFEDSQQWEACYTFTEYPRKLRALLKSEGAEAIRKAAEASWQDAPAAEINVVMLGIIEQLKRHVETTVRFAAEMEASGDVTFFREMNRQEQAASVG